MALFLNERLVVFVSEIPPGMQSDGRRVFSALEEGLGGSVWSNRHDKGEFFHEKALL